MGNALGSSGLAFTATVVIAVAAILIIWADSKVRSIPGFNGDVLNQDLDVAHKDLVYAQIFAWIGVAFSLLLALGYVLVNFELLQNEWVHFIILLIAVGALIVSIIYLGFAMNRVNNLEQGNQGSYSTIIWSIIVVSLGLLLLVVMGIWRLTHKNIVESKEKVQPMKLTTTQRRETPQGIYVTSSTRENIPRPPLAQSELPGTESNIFQGSI